MGIDEGVARAGGTCGGVAAIVPAVALVFARGVGGPGGFRQRPTAAMAAAVTRASNKSSAALDGVVLVFTADVVRIVEVVADAGEAALRPSVTLAFGWEAVVDVVGLVWEGLVGD